MDRGATRGTIATALLLAVMLLVFAGCGSSGSSSTNSGGEEAKAGGVIRIAQSGEPSTLNPSAMVEASSVEVSSQINETLYKLNEAGDIVPLLAAKSKHSKDGLTYTFQLRSGITFSNGRPMTADDVVFSLEAARKSSIWAGLWEDVDQVKALSPSSVQIKTKKPMAALLADLTSYSAAIVPDNYGGASEEEFAQAPIGTGPFVLGKWSHGKPITLKRNKSYWRPDLPLADEVVFTAVPDTNSQVSQLEGGAVDLIGQPPFSRLKGFEGSSTLQVGSYGMYQVDFVSLNLTDPHFQDRRVREAINLAIDRDGIVEAALDGFGEPAGSYLPPTVPYHDDSVKAPAQDLKQAKELLAAAVADGADPSFTLSTIAGDAYSTVASQVIQQNLREVGFDVELQPLDSSTLGEKWLTGEVAAALEGYYAGVPDPSELTTFYLSAIAEPNGVETGALEKVATRASAALEPKSRQPLYAQLQSGVAEELQLIGLSYQPAIWVMQQPLAGLEVNSINTISLDRTGFTD